jgi:hypothetical protein
MSECRAIIIIAGGGKSFKAWGFRRAWGWLHTLSPFSKIAPKIIHAQIASLVNLQKMSLLIPHDSHRILRSSDKLLLHVSIIISSQGRHFFSYAALFPRSIGFLNGSIPSPYPLWFTEL